MNLNAITKEQIILAIDYVETHKWEEKYNSKKYDLVVENSKCYPPKYVLAVAIHLATGQGIDTCKLIGGNPTNKHFIRNGFEIIKNK